MVNLRRTTRGRHGLLPLGATLEALGHDGRVGTHHDQVALECIVGSAERTTDFDAGFRLVNPALQSRWEAVAALVRSGKAPPVQLVQLDDLYFVADGHHRVSVGRHDGHKVVAAEVKRIGTVAYAMACLRAQHLDSKRAERRFLERVPLPDDVRRHLWLDRPADWSRLADAAEAWGLRRMLSSETRVLARDGLAAAWWHEEVQPTLLALRNAGIGLRLRDVELYVSALAVRDELGLTRWPDNPADMLHRINRRKRRRHVPVLVERGGQGSPARR